MGQEDHECSGEDSGVVYFFEHVWFYLGSSIIFNQGDLHQAGIGNLLSWVIIEQV